MNNEKLNAMHDEDPVFSTRRRADWFWFIGIAAIFVLLLARRFSDDSLGYPDADRILMDGIFFYDFFRDLPLFDIYGYITSYYAQYPALSIGYRPPFFPFVEGLFNTIFGPGIESSRAALMVFGVIGLAALFATVRSMYGIAAAVAASLILATTPFVLKLGWYTMGEIPVLSMALVTVFFFHRYLKTSGTWALAGTVVALVLAVWTKQTAIVLLLWMGLYIVTSGRLISEFRQRRVWLASGFVVVALLPLAAITLWLGEQNIAQSVGTGEGASIASRFDWSVLMVHVEQIYKLHVTAPVLVLALIGLVLALWKRDRRVWFWFSLILAVYVFFTYVKGTNARYPIFWIPAFSVLAALPLAYLWHFGGRVRGGLAATILAIAVWQVVLIYAVEPKYATGYDRAARFVIGHSEAPTVFFDGYNNGYFTYFMRVFDPDRAFYVLRGDKLLSSTSIGGRNRLEVHVEGADEIRQMLHDFGVQFVVVEDKNTIGIPIHDVLRKLLRDDDGFRLVETIPVDTGEPSTRPPLAGVALEVYEVLERQPAKDGVLELRLPVVGQTLRVPFRNIQDRELAP